MSKNNKTDKNILNNVPVDDIVVVKKSSDGSDDNLTDSDTSKKNDRDNVVDKKTGKKSQNRQWMCKSVVFKNERENIISKLNNILEIHGDMCCISIDNIDNDKIKKIVELVPDIQKFFVYGRWTYFTSTDSDNGHIALLKSVYKDMNYKVKQMISYETKNKIKHATHNLIIMKKT